MRDGLDDISDFFPSTLNYSVESQDQYFTLCFLCKKLSATLPWRKFQKLWLISHIFYIFPHTRSCTNPSPRTNSLPIIFSPTLVLYQRMREQTMRIELGSRGAFSRALGLFQGCTQDSCCQTIKLSLRRCLDSIQPYNA